MPAGMKLGNGEPLPPPTHEPAVIVDEVLKQPKRAVVLVDAFARERKRDHYSQAIPAAQTSDLALGSPRAFRRRSSSPTLFALGCQLVSSLLPKLSHLALMLPPLLQLPRAAAPTPTPGDDAEQLTTAIRVDDAAHAYRSGSDLPGLPVHPLGVPPEKRCNDKTRGGAILAPPRRSLAGPAVRARPPRTG
jgi:hypothetical protein